MVSRTFFSDCDSLNVVFFLKLNIKQRLGFIKRHHLKNSCVYLSTLLYIISDIKRSKSIMLLWLQPIKD